jgi:hypothetical protein
MAGMVTGRAILLPGAIVNGNVSEDPEEGIDPAFENSVVLDCRGAVLDLQKTIDPGADAGWPVRCECGVKSADADATVGRRSHKGNRISSTLKHAAEAAYNTATGMFQGTTVTALGAEFPEQHPEKRGYKSGDPLDFLAVTTAEFRVQPPQYRNPRCGPVKGLRRAIQREERRRGRNLNAEEWQSVRDGCIQRNRLKEMGLDFCFIKQRRSRRV